MNRSLFISLSILTTTILLSDLSPALAKQPQVPTLLAQSGNAQTFFEQGLQKYRNGDNQGALAALDQAIRLDSRFGEAYVVRGLARKRSGWVDGAIADYTVAIQLLPNGESKINAYFNRALAYSDNRRVAEALSDLTEAVRLKPNFAQAYYLRGFIRSENNDARGSIADFTKTLQIDGNYLRAYAQRGLTLLGYFGDSEGATRDFVAAARLTPQNNAEDFWNRGSAKYNLGDLRGAEADFSQSIQLNNRYLRAYYSRASVRYLLGNQQGAGADFQTANQLDAEDGAADPFLASSLSEIGFTEGLTQSNIELAQQALEVINEAIQQYPNKALLFYSRGTLRTQFDQVGAEADFSEAIRLEPDFATAYYQRSSMRSQQGNTQGALADMNQAIQIGSNFADAYFARGLLYLGAGNVQGQADLERATRLFIAVADLNPNSAAGAYGQLGSVFQSIGESGQALEAYQRAASIYQLQGNQVALRQVQQAIATVQQGGGSQQSSQQATTPTNPSGYILREQGTLNANSQALPDDGSFYQVHTFQGRRGQTVSIEMSSSDFDTHLFLLDPDGQLLEQNDDVSSDNINSQIRITLPQDGTYQVIANAHEQGEQGRYLVQVR